MRRLGLFLALVSLALVGCASSAPTPDLARIYSDPAKLIGNDRRPVIVIPGILGSKLEDPSSRTPVWGAFVYGAADADKPDGARLIALPMREGVPLRELRDEVTPTDVLDQIEVDTLAFVRGVKFDAYVHIMRTLAAGRYRDQSLGESGAIDYGGLHDTCFQFAYDWRRDIAESAALLHETILDAQHTARLAAGLPETEPLKVDVVAHSMGGLVLRYYLRYGTQRLPDDGSLPELTWAGAERVANAILVGTPNAGSALALEQLVGGWSLFPIGPTYRPAVLGTMPAVYQLLPRARHNAVIDLKTGAPIDVLDAGVWERYGWGLASPDADRVLRWLLPEVDRESDRRRIALDHLSKALARAEQTHRALDLKASPPPGTRLFLYAGDGEDTPETLSISSDGRLRVRSQTAGDGTVTRPSALMDERAGGPYLPRVRTPIDWHRVQFCFTDHIGLTNDPAFVDNLLFTLLEAPESPD
ncbi:MAG: hypothetical protein RIB32_00285 [Phycisphaerales bacterium]